MARHLIHIGYAKTGSTFLKHWFENHPEIAFCRLGIAGFRDINGLVREGAAPTAGVRVRVTSSEALATPHVHVGKPGIAKGKRGANTDPVAQAEVCRMLAALFPKADVLLVTRGFRSVLMSGYSQYVRAGGDTDFPSPLPAAPEAGAHMWHYDYLIDVYSRAFGDRLIVLPYELLRDDPAAFVGEIELRLGLSHCPPPGRRLNPALSPVELRWYPRLTRFMARLPVGARLRRALMPIYFRVIMRNRLRLPIRLLQLVRPAEPVTRDLVTDEMVEYFRGRAEFARTNPLYAPYADDYLL